MSTYVYGITARTHPAPPADLTGVGEPPGPVRVLTAGELAAVVSDAPEGLRPERRDLLAHQNVLAETGTAGCVLPLRFGNVAPDDAAVTHVLDERADHYLERLTALDGRVEYHVEAGHIEDAVLHRVMAENAEIRALAEADRRAGGGDHDDRLRLGELVVAAVRAQAVRDAAEVQARLAPAAAAVGAGPQSTGGLLDVSFLVARDAARDFLAAVEQARACHPHLTLHVDGPLPPYSFVEPGPAQPAADTETP
ncbi:GvpL/GvpF family gas vesicle protein [Streptomyces sp. NPDC052101]|uniref:GvpL/GvpF family gas vesicle protein n=1 Tax=Streptomyces sp. NPDC052101 TaxID=3155763 RepID=UPI0034289EFB